MKSVTLFLSIGLFTLPAASYLHAADELPVVAHRAGRPLTGGPVLALGDSEETVIALIGEPAAKPAPDVWVYWDYSINAETVDPKFDTLLVFFAGGHVTEFRLVEGQTIRKLLARIEAKNASKAR